MPRILTTMPPSSAFSGPDYIDHATRVAQWSEENGISGALIYTDNSLADPWSVAQFVLERTQNFVPLIATQPIYMPPFTVAKRIATLAMLYGRPVALNMVAGGFPRDLSALGDTTPHDERYARLEEYTSLIMALLRNETVSLAGSWSTLDQARLAPEMLPELMPEIFVSGASEVCAATAIRLGATAVNYPPPPGAIETPPPRGSVARIGIIARDTEEAAWRIAHSRFPKDPRGRMAFRLATATSDSVWLKQFGDLGEVPDATRDDHYWLHPLNTYRTFCPYLVGTHHQVGRTLRRYQEIGFDRFILDIPTTADDLPNALEAFRISDTILQPA